VGPDDLGYALNNLGIAFFGASDYGEAAVKLREALGAKKKFPEAHYNLGLTYEATAKPQGAIAEFQQALRLKPDYPEARTGLGLAYVQKRNSAMAEAQFQRALRSGSGSARVRGAAHADLGYMFEKRGMRLKAIDEFHEAVDSDPDDAEAHYDLGAELVNQFGKTYEQAAEKELRRAVNLKPDFYDAHVTLAGLLMDEGKRGTALAEYRQLERLRRDDAEWHEIADMLLKTAK
jgi:Tfp pilus assembly protein PilF